MNTQRKPDAGAVVVTRRHFDRDGRKRTFRRSLNDAIAAQAIGPIEPGCEIFGLTGGQFSLIDVIKHCLSEVGGNADVVISTWTTSASDLEFVDHMNQDAIRSLRFIVDFSYPSRQPEECAILRGRFGDDAIRILKTHCKFVLISAGARRLVIRSSMNLSKNRRLENFEISDDPMMHEHLLEFVDMVFREYQPGLQFKQRPADNAKDFIKLTGASEQQADAEWASGIKQGAEYLGDGPADRDVRRAGITTSRGRRL